MSPVYTRDRIGRLGKDLAELVEYVDRKVNDDPLRPIGFVLLLHPRDDMAGGRCACVANGAAPEAIVQFLKQQVERLEEAIAENQVPHGNA